MTEQKSTGLTSEQRARYQQTGYHVPLRAFPEAEAAQWREKFLSYWKQNEATLKSLLPRQRGSYLIETHLFLRWVYDIVSHPRILDAVESVLGPDVLVWSSQWFPKFPHDSTYVSWHQDATYWGLSPPNVTTAWVALTESSTTNGCLRVMPGSHLEMLPQRETYAETNMLSRGQEIEVEVDESKAVDFELHPGEFSLHHIGIVHGSGPNDADVPRIGLAIRYISPDVVQQGQNRDMVLPARGRDEFGHFDIVEPPDRDYAYGESPVHKESLDRKMGNLMAGARDG